MQYQVNLWVNIEAFSSEDAKQIAQEQIQKAIDSYWETTFSPVPDITFVENAVEV